MPSLRRRRRLRVFEAMRLERWGACRVNQPVEEALGRCEEVKVMASFALVQS